MENIVRVGKFITLNHYDSKDEKGNVVIDDETHTVVQKFNNIAILIDSKKEKVFSGQVIMPRVAEDYKGIDLLTVKSDEKYFVLINQRTYDGTTSYQLTYCGKQMPEISLED